MRDYLKEAEQEFASNEASHRWVQARVEEIHRRITTYDVLLHFRVPLRYGDGRREQFSCPFHGIDTKPSARVYPASDRSPSHAWCFVCQERWDAITLWKKFTAFEGSFTRLLATIEKEYGITPPEAPPTGTDTSDPARLELMELFAICERRLQSGKRAFTMRGFLTIGSVLDRLYFQVDENLVSVRKAKTTLSKVLDKIGEKTRACPDG